MQIKGLEVITAVLILPPSSPVSMFLYACVLLGDVICALILSGREADCGVFLIKGLYECIIFN